MTDERLIEEAGKAILRAHDRHPQPGEDGFDNDAVAWAEALARAALAVFEKAHNPTEEKPVAYGIYGRVTGSLKYVQVMDEREVEEQSEFYDVVPLFRRLEPQREPSDAQVEAALIAHLGYDPAPAGFPFKDGEKDQMRAALRAAEEAK